VDFLISIDRKSVFLFAPLQGLTAQENGIDNHQNSLQSLTLLKGGKVYKKSTAVFEILKILEQPYRILSVGSILPIRLTDFFYNIISNNRYKIFGRSDTCRIPKPEELKRFLD